MTTLYDIKQSALSLFTALDSQYREPTPAFDEHTFDDVLNYLQSHLSGTTKNFPYECRVLFLNQETDKLLEQGKFSAYFNIVEFGTSLQTEIVVGRTDIHQPNISYLNDIDHLLHEYGHFQSLVDWCMDNHPKPGDILETRSGMRYSPCYDLENYWVNEARSIFHEEVMACRYAVETVEKLPITEPQKLALMKVVKDSSEYTLKVYAANIDRLVERENNNGKDIIPTIIPITEVSTIHSEVNLPQSLSKAG